LRLLLRYATVRLFCLALAASPTFFKGLLSEFIGTPDPSHAQTLPSECRPRIGLAAGRNVAVAADALRRDGGIGLLQQLAQRDQRGILRVAERFEITAFQLDADGEVIAALAFAETRHPRMPGAIQTGN